MKRREDAPLQKYTINLFQEDWDKLQTILPPKVSASKLLRRLLRRYLRKIEASSGRTPEIDLEEILE